MSRFDLFVVRSLHVLTCAGLLGAWATLVPSAEAASKALTLDVPPDEILTVASASSPQPAYSGAHTVQQAIDGSLETPNWHAPGQKLVEGEFTFDQPEEIHYISFCDANFPKVTLEAHSGGTWKKLGSFELGGSKVVKFKSPLTKVDKIKMAVEYQEGENLGFALRELRFCRRLPNPLTKQILKVFKDTSCSELVPNCKVADVKPLPKLLQTVAAKLKKGTYPDKEFRIGTYKAFSNPDFAGKVRHVNALNKYDNPTGIVANEGDELIVFVGPTNGEDIALASVSPAGIDNTLYPLNEGINKINITRSGLLYVMYHTDISKPHKPITVHIPVGQGTVNGYFDVTRHTDKDWQRMIAKAPHKVFDIVGRQSMMTLHTEYLRQYSPDSISQSVQVWDESVQAMWKIMGWDRYPQPINNRQYGLSTESGPHMYASVYYCGYSLGDQGHTMQNEVIAPGILQGNRLWGIGHEIGHCYQHLFNWRSMTESCNNFFAQLILDQVANKINGNELASDMENPCKYLLEEAVKGKPFHDLNGWAKWGFAQYSFYLYFHKLGINPDFYPKMFESLRKKPLVEHPTEDVTASHLAWYERVCNLSKTDFTEDFETFNWFVPIEHSGNQYGEYTFNMTKAMADASKARIAAKHYPKPKYRIAFLHQHGKTVDLWGLKLHGSELNGYWKKYRDNPNLSPSVCATKEGTMIKVTNGEAAAAFCVRTNGKIVGYYDRPQFDIGDIEWNETSQVEAIPALAAEPYKVIYSEKRK
jgi:hypothetical protein